MNIEYQERNLFFEKDLEFTANENKTKFKHKSNEEGKHRHSLLFKNDKIKLKCKKVDLGDFQFSDDTEDFEIKVTVNGYFYQTDSEWKKTLIKKGIKYNAVSE